MWAKSEKQMQSGKVLGEVEVVKCYDVRLGCQQSEHFHPQTRAMFEDNCFSIVSHERTLDLEAECEYDAKVFVRLQSFFLSITLPLQLHLFTKSTSFPIA